MVVHVENSPKKSCGQISFYSNCSSSRNMHEEDSSESFSKHLSSKVGSPSPCCLKVKHLGPRLQDQELSSSQSTSQSQQEATMMGKPNSQEQCISSKIVQDESYEKHVQGQLRPAFLICNPDFCTNPSQLEMSQSSIHIPYAYSEAYFNGLFTAYGPHVAVQPQMVGIPPGRVPLPADLAEDGPIYVNAKQYHGILRRRQIRAKLEAQNKLVKTRKPYLHESRHLHALNRVRGSGGRFVGSKKAQQPEATPSTSSSLECGHFHQNGNMSKVDEQYQLEAAKHVDAPTAMCYDITQDTDSVVNFDQPNHRLSTLYSRMAVRFTGKGGLTRGGEQHSAPVV